MAAARPARPLVAPAPRPAPPSLLGAVPQKEEGILSAALDLFVARGFHATTIPEIARRAGVAAGTIYLYFSSKEELVNALLGRLKGHLAARLVAEVPRRGDVRAQFEAIWGVFAGFVLHHERAMAFCDLHHHAEYLTPATLAAWDPARRLLTAHFQAGRRRGVYRDLPPAALRGVLLGVLLGLHKMSRLGELRLTPALLDAAREAAWAGVAADPGGGRRRRDAPGGTASRGGASRGRPRSGRRRRAVARSGASHGARRGAGGGP